MIIFRQVDIYGPGYMGVNGVLVCDGRIEAVGDHLEEGSGCSEIDAREYSLTPGLIDQHEHIIGGGGEGSFHTRTPEVQLPALIQASIATVLGLLETGDVTRDIESLVAGAKGLREEGVTALVLCGAYGCPSPTITDGVKEDIVLVDEILGLKLALSDHRTPNISTEELIRLASDMYTAGMINGKPRFIVLHMGDGERRLDQVFEALERTDIPVRTFHPTHMSRTPEFLQSEFRLAKVGGYIDITCKGGERIQDGRLSTERVVGILRGARSQEVPMDRITFNSDDQGSWSSYDEYGHLRGIGVTGVRSMYRQLKYLMTQGKMDLSETLPFFTSNVARALEMYPRKGCVAPGTDTDLLLIHPNMALDAVITGGKAMMAEGNLKRKGTYEAECRHVKGPDRYIWPRWI